MSEEGEREGRDNILPGPICSMCLKRSGNGNWSKNEM